jgi:hypothetical protein
MLPELLGLFVFVRFADFLTRSEAEEQLAGL